jgi:Uma2 family endonuclease
MLQTNMEIEYPDTDGRPMGETDLHRDWMFRIINLLKHRYRDQRVYVTGNLLLYYEEGYPAHFVVPDAMVVKDCDPGRRRVFKIWEEDRTPCAVFETTSRSTKREDEVFKTQLYQQLGIGEYFFYDPTAEYLRPPLQGHRLTDGRYQPIEPDANGRLHSRELDLLFFLDSGDLVMVDATTGERVLTETEAALAAHNAAQTEIERLRKKLDEHGLSD